MIPVASLLDGARITAEVVLAAALVLSIVIVVHESGHFVFAKLFGVRVDEFAVGFGPRLISRRWGETRYAIRAVPAGGFVRMAGMLGLEGEADAGPRNFHRATVPRRIVIMVAGILFNLIFAGICFSILRTLPTESHVSATDAAYRGGLRDGDVITRVDGAVVDRADAASTARDLHRATAVSAGRPMTIGYRDPQGHERQATVRPELVLANGVAPSDGGGLPVGSLVITAINGRPVGTGDPGSLLGGGAGVRVSGHVQGTDPPRTFTDVAVSGVRGEDEPSLGARGAAWRLGYSPGVEGQSPPAAAVNGFVDVPRSIGNIASGLWRIVTSPAAGGINGPQGLSGPVGIAFASSESVRHGLASFVEFLGFISVSVGFLNLLPIPFLDGGRIVFVLLEAVRRRRLDPKLEAMVYATSLAFMVIFALYITIGDINRIPDFLSSR